MIMLSIFTKIATDLLNLTLMASQYANFKLLLINNTYNNVHILDAHCSNIIILH